MKRFRGRHIPRPLVVRRRQWECAATCLWSWASVWFVGVRERALSHSREERAAGVPAAWQRQKNANRRSLSSTFWRRLLSVHELITPFTAQVSRARTKPWQPAVRRLLRPWRSNSPISRRRSRPNAKSSLATASSAVRTWSLSLALLILFADPTPPLCLGVVFCILQPRPPTSCSAKCKSLWPTFRRSFARWRRPSPTACPRYRR